MRYNIVSWSALGLTVLLSGCAPETGNYETSKPKTLEIAGPASPGKPGAPITISHAVNGVRAVGHTIRVDLSVIPKSSASRVTITVSSTGGLQIVTPDSTKSYDNVVANTAINHSIDMIPQSNGLFYLNVFIDMESDGAQATKVVAIPIEVGLKGKKPKMKTTGPIKEDEKGQKTIPMPADVTIIRK